MIKNVAHSHSIEMMNGNLKPFSIVRVSCAPGTNGVFQFVCWIFCIKTSVWCVGCWMNGKRIFLHFSSESLWFYSNNTFRLNIPAATIGILYFMLQPFYDWQKTIAMEPSAYPVEILIQLTDVYTSECMRMFQKWEIIMCSHKHTRVNTDY